MIVLSVQPEADTDFFTAGGRRRVVRRSLHPASVIDVREILSTKKDPAGEMISLLDRVRRNRPGQSPPLIIGDWIHETYGNIDIALTVEESEREESNTFCCYRGEGFWSLGCGQIAQVFHLHQRVIFGSSVFEMGRP
jgi:hypothetical protein